MKSTTVLALFVAVVVAGHAFAGQSVQPARMAEPAYAMVRFVQLWPNAGAADVALMRTNTEGVMMTPAGLTGLTFGSATDYVRVPSGEYAVMLAVTDAVAGATEAPLFAGPDPAVDPAPSALDEKLVFRADRHYTVAILGLVMPRDPPRVARQSGLFDRLSALFSVVDAAEKDALGLRLAVFEDDPEAAVASDVAHVRIVHAAPGATSLDVAVAGERDTLVRNLAFGETSRNVRLRAGDTTLEVRLSGSRAVALDLSDVGLEPGTTYTVFIAGTPVEAVPLRAVVLSGTPIVRQGDRRP